tara:strand:- start:460 stop:651 length:192 start_codon:yes stop_codon:yes gene_type:complete
MRLIDLKHLDASNERGYFSHMFHALKISIWLFLAGSLCAIHAVCPVIFVDAASRIVRKLYYKI